MRTFIVDTVGTIVFFTIIAALTELFVAGMEPHQVLTARLIMIPIMVLTGRPYTLWRDWVFARCAPQGPVMNTIADVTSFLTFQVPVYVATLFISGANFIEIQVAVGAAILFMIILSRPFGLFLELLRRWTNTTVA